MRQLLILLIPIFSFAQSPDFPEVVAQINQGIKISEGNKKLKLLDSLTRMVEFNEDFEYTKLANQTIALAIEKDSLKIATRLTSDLIFYNASILRNSEKALAIFNDFKNKAFDLKNRAPTHWANCHMYAGDATSSTGKYEAALNYFEKAKELSIYANNNQRIAQNYRRLGFTKGQLGLFAEASQDIQEAIKIFTKLKDTINIVQSKESASILYSQNGFFKEAQSEREEAFELLDRNHPAHIVNHLNAALDFREQKKNKQWLQSLKQAQSMITGSPYEQSYSVFLQHRLIIAYVANDSLDKARSLINEVEDNKDTFAQPDFYGDYLESKKYFAKAEKNYTEAIKIGKEHLALKRGEDSFVEIYNSEKFLADVYALIGDQNNANAHLTQYYKIKDSISSVQNVKSLAYYQTLYETDKKDLTIKNRDASIALLAEKDKVRNQWFLLLGVLGIVGIIGFVLYKNYKQKLQRRIAVEQLRTQISADLHDDVGSLLTGLSMQTELLAKQVPEEQKFKLERVSAISKDAMLKMRDAVWAMDARKDNWQSLTDRMNEFAIENLQTKDIAYTLDVNNIELSKAMQGAVRQNLYLIFKEAIANVLKHSNATKVNVQIKKQKNNFIMDIADNGSSQKKLSKAGQGLTNMTLRATQILGNLNYRNDNGFKITVAIPAS